MLLAKITMLVLVVTSIIDVVVVADRVAADRHSCLDGVKKCGRNLEEAVRGMGAEIVETGICHPVQEWINCATKILPACASIVWSGVINLMSTYNATPYNCNLDYPRNAATTV